VSRWDGGGLYSVEDSKGVLYSVEDREDGVLYSVEASGAAGEDKLEAVVLRDGDVAPLSSLSYSAMATASLPWILRCFLSEEG